MPVVDAIKNKINSFHFVVHKWVPVLLHYLDYTTTKYYHHHILRSFILLCATKGSILAGGASNFSYKFSCKNLTVLEVIFLSFCENDEGNPFNLTAKPDLEWSKDDGFVSFSIESGGLLFSCKAESAMGRINPSDFTKSFWPDRRIRSCEEPLDLPPSFLEAAGCLRELLRFTICKLIDDFFLVEL